MWAVDMNGKAVRNIRDAFSAFHPVVNFLYFAVIIGFSMFFMHPIHLLISFICAASYAIYLYGKKAVLVGFIFLLPMFIFAAVMNPLFNHRGATILEYLPNGNPLTLESIAFGIGAATMLITVITWFSCVNAIMTSDKFVYLIGRFIPSLSLILSMALQFVPRFKAQIKVVSNTQKSMGKGFSVRRGIKVLSIVVTWALENAVETADSMKSRGYGLPGRTAFSIFYFTKRDGIACAYILANTAAIIIGVMTGSYHFRYFPTIRGSQTLWIFACYFALGAFPLIINLKEDFIWRRIESKI